MSSPPLVQGFRKLVTVDPTASGHSAPDNVTQTLKGTRPSLHSSIYQTSTGIQSLDLLLGNGVNLSTSILIQEQDRGQYTPLFAKHFISEGLSHGHTIVCGGERVSSWLTTLPRPVEQESSPQSTEGEESLKIAWRYKRRIQNRYSHSYDLSQHRLPEEVSSCHVIPTSYNPASVVESLERIISEHPDRVVRVVLDRPLFPVSDDAQFLRFHYNLRRILSLKNVVTMCLYPIYTMSDTVSFHLPQLFHNVLNIESLPRDKNSVFKDYHGRLKLIRIDNTCSFTMPLYDMTDRFFKVQRKKFIIEKMYLPPDLSETVSRSTAAASTGGCATSKGIDF